MSLSSIFSVPDAASSASITSATEISSSTSTTSTSSSSTSTSQTTSSTTSSTTSATSTSSSSSSSTTTSSSTSSTLPSTSSAQSSTPSSSTSLQLSTQPDGATQTVTVVNSVTPSSSSTAPSSTSSASNSTGNGFWDSKGAVAGTFTVVAVIGAAILFWAILWFIRRRRARKFDLESEEAAVEAAKAQVPVYLDDDNDRPTYGSSYHNEGLSAGYSGYVPSASSHGTYAQPAMGYAANENYPMAELGAPHYAGDSPYPAFMAPGRQPTYNGYEPQHNNYGGYDYGHGANEALSSPPMDAGRPLSGSYSIPENPDHGEAAGIGAAGVGMAYAPAAVSRGHSTTTSASQSQTSLSRNKSQARSLLATSPSNAHDPPSASSGESYAAHYQPGFSGYATPSRRSTLITYDEDVPALPNPFSRATDEDEDEDEDDEEEHHARKVLKVANE